MLQTTTDASAARQDREPWQGRWTDRLPLRELSAVIRSVHRRVHRARSGDAPPSGAWQRGSRKWFRL